MSLEFKRCYEHEVELIPTADIPERIAELTAEGWRVRRLIPLPAPPDGGAVQLYKVCLTRDAREAA